MIFAALVVPANLVVAGPLRSVGSASRILGLVAVGLLLAIFLQREVAQSAWGRTFSGSRAVPMAFILYLITIVALYGLSNRRIMAPEEVGGGTRYLVSTVALVGAGLAIALFVADRRGLRAVMGCVVAAVGLCALAGIIQSRSSLDLTSLLRLPGLVVNREVETAATRNSFTRVAGSSGHPIEFTVIVASAVPFALYVSTYAGTKLRRQLAGIAAAMMLIALPLGVSRSGVLGVGVALLLYSVVWTWRQRLTALVIAFVGLVFYRIVQPGVLGTILGLFTNASTDTSVTARTEDYPRIDALLAGREIVGIGPGTFLPDLYFIIDNQYLLSYVEGGVIGVLALSALSLTGLVVAQMARRRAVEKPMKDAAQAIFASIAAVAACASTFDLMSFQQISFIMFAYIGMASAALVVVSVPSDAAPSDRSPAPVRTR